MKIIIIDDENLTAQEKINLMQDNGYDLEDILDICLEINQPAMAKE